MSGKEYYGSSSRSCVVAKLVVDRHGRGFARDYKIEDLKPGDKGLHLRFDTGDGSSMTESQRERLALGFKTMAPHILAYLGVVDENESAARVGTVIRATSVTDDTVRIGRVLKATENLITIRRLRDDGKFVPMDLPRAAYEIEPTDPELESSDDADLAYWTAVQFHDPKDDPKKEAFVVACEYLNDHEPALLVRLASEAGLDAAIDYMPEATAEVFVLDDSTSVVRAKAAIEQILGEESLTRVVLSGSSMRYVALAELGTRKGANDLIVDLLLKTEDDEIFRQGALLLRDDEQIERLWTTAQERVLKLVPADYMKLSKDDRAPIDTLVLIMSEVERGYGVNLSLAWKGSCYVCKVALSYLEDQQSVLRTALVAEHPEVRKLAREKLTAEGIAQVVEYLTESQDRDERVGASELIKSLTDYEVLKGLRDRPRGYGEYKWAARDRLSELNAQEKK